MKFTTLNLKKDDYAEKHEIFVGTHIGSFKRLDINHEDPYKQENLQNLKELEKNSTITSLSFCDIDKNEVLIGRANKLVQVYDLTSRTFKNSVEFSSSPVGVCFYGGKIVAGLKDGNVEISENSSAEAVTVLNAGDNMSRMRQCSFDNRLIATGGKERQNNLKVFDLETKKKIFTSKNLPNDHLQLEVPIWDSDISFLNPNTLTTCSRYGYIRLYDIRAQRRPVKKYSNEAFSFSCMIGHENNIFLGTIKGELKSFDTRILKTFQHTYKGCTGGVSDLCLDETGKFLISANLDRYVRVHNTDSCVLLYQCYVKTKATRVLVRNIQDESHQQDSLVQNEESTIFERNVNNKSDNCASDEEYEQMFENMETVTENKNVNEDVVVTGKRKSKEGKKLKTKRKKS